MTKRNLIATLAVFGTLAVGGDALPVASVVRYDIILLQPPPGAETADGAFCEPAAMNSRGEAVGRAEVLGSKRQEFHAVFWDALGQLHEMAASSSAIQYDAQSINDSGQIVGTAVPRKSDKTFPFLARNGQIVPLKTLSGFAGLIARGRTLEAFDGGEAINNAGQILFHVEVKDRAMERVQDLRVGPQAVLYDAGRFKELDPLPNGDSVRAYGLNDAGMVVGASNTGSRPAGELREHAFLWQNGDMTDLGVPAGFDESDARAVNMSGQVVGTMSHSADWPDEDPAYEKARGYFWDHGVVQNLGTLSGCAYTEPTGINASGQVVGNSYNIQKENDPDSGVMYSQIGGVDGGCAFLWQNGKMQNLQKLVPAGWELQSAVAINDRGEILCTGYHNGIASNAFILRPR